ncbi:MAG: hypothetical protein NTV86_04465 [Planctomycetota bacterium]|nr:hypothetical protein [Planctomycetota bacterium]
MDKAQRQLIHVAESIHQQLKTQATGRLCQVVNAAQNLLGNLAQLGRLGELLAVCAGRQWNAAAENVCDRIRRSLGELSYYSTQVEQSLDLAKTTQQSSLRDILADMAQAQDEFDDFRYSPDTNALSVTVGPVELKGIQLGEFEIRLLIPNMAQANRSNTIYRVVALDPHPAGSNESVTHPHVSDERLCEGEASAAIRAALANGRVCDFFHLVGAVLTTYNPHSPYVSLDNWEGIACHECGYTMGESDAHWCESCQHDFCDECISQCRRCDESSCRGCLEECSVCGESMCSSCMTGCVECGERLCRNCVDDGQCPCLKETQPDNEEDDHDSVQSAPTSVGVSGEDGAAAVPGPRVEAA